ncbi:MAG: hypothetical protein PUE46_01810 [Eubacteriales bacterium]|nr:hypothetical protein [Eubacteriales bacterium]
MPMIAQGVYSDTEDKPYEFESGYYVDFQITSALFSLESVMNSNIKNYGILKSKYQYYHYYYDHLIFSIGQIANRFDIKDKDEGIVRERKNANICNFAFSKEKYPILSDKRVRNTIEHIDEYNLKIIKKYRGVGGFNLIDSETDKEVVKSLTLHRQSHPYTIDLINKQLLIMRNDIELNLNLEELQNELLSLQKETKSLLNFTTN